jgi:hypothetical protein
VLMMLKNSILFQVADAPIDGSFLVCHKQDPLFDDGSLMHGC